MALRDLFSVLQRGHATVRLPIWYRSVAFFRLQKITLKEFANWLLDTLQESLQSLCPYEYPLVYVLCAALWVGCAVCSDMCQSPNIEWPWLLTCLHKGFHNSDKHKSQHTEIIDVFQFTS
jgi:hypothetical protein